MTFRVDGDCFHLRVSRGDCELRLGRRMLTVLWNGHGDGGVFLKTKRGERHWSWADLRESFTSGQELLIAP